MGELARESQRGWFWPTAARKAHFDPGGDSGGIALCGKWGRAGFGGKAPIIAPVDAAPSPDDCAVCRRKLEAMVCGGG